MKALEAQLQIRRNEAPAYRLGRRCFGRLSGGIGEKRVKDVPATGAGGGHQAWLSAVAELAVMMPWRWKAGHRGSVP